MNALSARAVSAARALGRAEVERRGLAHPNLSPEWGLLARRDQLPPEGPWARWLILSGRGWGKTRTGVEWVISKARSYPGCRIALLGRTAGDVYKTMLDGESGLLKVSPPDFEPVYNPSKCRVTWPNGSVAETFSADEPRQLRGPQFHAAWVDELAAFDDRDAWDMLMMGLRLELPGDRPQVVITTTPRPVSVVRQLLQGEKQLRHFRCELADPKATSGWVENKDDNTRKFVVCPGGDCVQVVTRVRRGRTYDNRANLAREYFDSIISQYEGTRLGRQEIDGEVLEDVEGALWMRSWFDRWRVPAPPPLVRVVVGVDPATTSGEGADSTGIIVAGLDEAGRGYVLADLTMRDTPDKWAQAVVGAYRDWKAHAVVAETNQGGEMVTALLRHIDATLPIRTRHAKVGKVARAEPIAALYEQGRISHVGPFNSLEDQLTTYAPGSKASPDRMDALVYALGDLYEHERTIPVPVLNPRLDPDLERLRSGEPDRPQFRGWASDLGGLWND